MGVQPAAFLGGRPCIRVACGRTISGWIAGWLAREQAELARLKREAAGRRAAAAVQQQQQQAAQAAAAAALPAAAAAHGSVPAADAPPVITEDLMRTLKVSWSVKVGAERSCSTSGPMHST